MNLFDLHPKKTSFLIKIGGRKKRLFLRPFLLRDEAFIQKNWNAQELIERIGVKHDIKLIAQLIWHQLTPKSKKFIMSLNLQYIDIDDVTGEKISVKPNGVERLLNILDEGSLADGLDAFIKCKGLNSEFLAGQLGNEKKKENLIDWGEIFDLISSEYGYSANDIFNMTVTQVQSAIHNINIRLHNNACFEAKLHGAKTKPINREELKAMQAAKAAGQNFDETKAAESANKYLEKLRSNGN